MGGIRRFSLLLLLLLVGTGSAFAANGEYIVVVGGPSLYQWEKYKLYPHDHWWANFVRAARLRTDQLRTQLGPDQQITWLVYKQGYLDRAKQEHQDLIALIDSVREKLNLNLVWFNAGPDVIEYLNKGQPRNQVKITGFEYFGHSNRACFMFDYSNVIDSACSVVARERAGQDRPARFRAQRLRKKLGLPYRREHVEEVVSRYRHAYDRRNRKNAVHDGRAADPHFRRREVG